MNPTLDLVAVEWQRVQLVMGMRGTVDEVAAVTGLGLTRTGRRSGETMAATAVIRTDDGLLVRYNVMAGPRRRPLDPGRWVVTHAGPSGRAVLHLRTGDLDGLQAAKSFRLPHSRYDAKAVVDPEDGRLELTIDVDPFDGLLPTRWPRWRAGRRPVHALLVATHRATRRLLQVVARSASRRTGHRIVFATAAKSGLSGNLKVVRDRMLERGLGADYDLVVLHQPPAATSLRGWRERWRSTRLLLGAEAILVAGSRQRAVYGLSYDPDVRFIQLWHASGAFKTVGYSRCGKPLAPNPYELAHKDYTHAIVSSDHDVAFYAEAFSIPESRVVPIGIPRMDRFFHEPARTAGRAAALAAFPALEGRRVWLFAPTFRGDAHAATYDCGRVDLAGLHALAVERDAVVIFKMHPFVMAPVPIPEPFTDRLVDGTRTKVDVNDLLFVVDLLITDYSSILFEFSVLDRPMLFFAYDLDEYIAERDFYVPFETFVPGRIVRTSDELLDAIRREDYEVEKVGAFVAAHFAHLDGHATDRIIDELVLAR